MSKPYKEIQISENKKLRFFRANVINESELEWHRDRNNRLVEVLEANGWKFQYDNELPIPLQEGDKLFIPKEHFHRVIKGNGDLVVEITENPSENVLKEAKGSTKGYLYQIIVRMITDRKRNKSEIINDLRSIKDVTVVSVIPGQNFALQRTALKEKTMIKIKFNPGSSPLSKIKEIKAAAFGRSTSGGCSHSKIDGLVELDFKRDTLEPIRTY